MHAFCNISGSRFIVLKLLGDCREWKWRCWCSSYPSRHLSSVWIMIVILQHQDRSDHRQTHNHHSGGKILRWNTHTHTRLSRKGFFTQIESTEICAWWCSIHEIFSDVWDQLLCHYKPPRFSKHNLIRSWILQNHTELLGRPARKHCSCKDTI